ncbi:MAG: hypothetical protein FWG98_05880 [Candidatus Cloacimonetes bacterium]|nr:hypothetical protein [Candidatus Cloacimonadota bacterium]
MSTFRDAVCSGGACLRSNILYNGKLDGGKLRHYNHKLPKVDRYGVTLAVTHTQCAGVLKGYPYGFHAWW